MWLENILIPTRKCNLDIVTAHRFPQVAPGLSVSPRCFITELLFSSWTSVLPFFPFHSERLLSKSPFPFCSRNSPSPDSVWRAMPNSLIFSPCYPIALPSAPTPCLIVQFVPCLKSSLVILEFGITFIIVHFATDSWQCRLLDLWHCSPGSAL